MYWYSYATTPAISIHALLAESDAVHFDTLSALAPISIHALLAESDPPRGGDHHYLIPNFYPRSPCGERLNSSCISSIKKNFYPRSPCGERHAAVCRDGVDFGISIHALLAESDLTPARISSRLLISIHALLAESDRQNPGKHYVAFRFLSTLSLRRATVVHQWVCRSGYISIHALLAESDPLPRRLVSGIDNFYPRSPCGERLNGPVSFFNTFAISIHALLAESDRLGLPGWLRVLISIHALLAESDAVAL